MTFLDWLRNEWRLLRLEHWADEPRSTLGTMADPRVAMRVLQQRAYGKRLRRQGRSLLGERGKEYRPALTSQQPAKPEESSKVVRLRRRQI